MPRPAPRALHRVRSRRVHVSGLKGVVGFVGHHFVKSAYWVASSRSAASSALVTLHADHPRAVRILVDGFRMLHHAGVHFRHLTAHRTVQLGTAFTDSIVPKTSPRFNVRPTAGSSR